MPEDIKKAQTTTQATIGIAMTTAAVVSMVNMTSPIGIWSIIHLFQMLLLLILTGAFIPETVRRYLIGSDFTQLSFNFIPICKVPFFSDLCSNAKFEQQSNDLRDIGIEYQSTIINNIQLCTIIIILILSHILIALIKKRAKTGKCEKLINVMFQMLTFTIYLRLILESTQYILLCSVSEIYKFEVSSMYAKISLIVACNVTAALCAFYFFIIYEFQATKIWLNRKYHSYSEELFAGLKDNTKARSYSILLFTRRIILSTMLICLQEFNFIYRVISFAFVQVPYCIIIISIRPFAQVSNNIVEAINELLLAISTSFLLYYNEQDKWKNYIEKSYVYLITGSSANI